MRHQRELKRQTIVIGQMDNSDGTFESANRVYGSGGGGSNNPDLRRGRHSTKGNKDMETVFRTNGRICAMRGRNPDNPSDRTRGIYLEQRLEIGGGVSNTLTTVGKDNLILSEVEMEEKTLDDYLYHGKDGNDYGIFKLSPRECLRLMNVFDTDIDKMAAVNSNSQLYKTAGNSIVVSVLCAIFSQLHIQGIKTWNDMTEEERKELIYDKNFMDK